MRRSVPDASLSALAGAVLRSPAGALNNLLVGFSGGADSTALLLAAELACRDSGKRLTAVHVNHGLRGASSDADEAFARKLCDRLGVSILVYRLSLSDCSEQTAREGRYGAFLKAYQSIRADALLLAHHRGDQAETVLLHLMRGAGLDGLCGISGDTFISGMRVIRPFLNIDGAALRQALTEVHQPWREDESNATDVYLRNAVRQELLPLMDSMIPGASGRIANSALLLQTDAEFLTCEASAFLECFASAHALPIDKLLGLHPAVRLRALRLWWQAECNIVPDSEQTRRMSAAISAPPGTKTAVCGPILLETGYRFIHALLKNPACGPLAVSGLPGEYPLGSEKIIISGSAGGPGDGRTSQELPRAMLDGACVRTRRTGDVIRPFGSKGAQSLQDYFINKKIDAPFRDRVPILFQGSEALWIPGVGAGAVPRWSPQADPVRLTAAGPVFDLILNKGAGSAAKGV